MTRKQRKKQKLKREKIRIERSRIARSEYESKCIVIKNWDDLAQLPISETHYIEPYKLGYEYGSWVQQIDPIERELKWEDNHYLSTHSFYGGFNDIATQRILRKCGFDVIVKGEL